MIDEYLTLYKFLYKLDVDPGLMERVHEPLTLHTHVDKLSELVLNLIFHIVGIFPPSRIRIIIWLIQHFLLGSLECGNDSLTYFFDRLGVAL